jgi:hypothetical protein
MSEGENEVTENKYDVLGPLYADIGGELADIVGGDPDGTFLYAEAGEGWLSSGIFKDEGAAIRYFRPTSELTDLLLEAWNTEEPDKRWAVMEYEIKGTKFDVRFKFPDEVVVGDFDPDRKEAALKNHFGDKPVLYPPWPPEKTGE